MTTELDVLGLVSDGLSASDLPFMPTGSFALAYYATPRMTRDLDIVVALVASDVDALVAAFESDFYIDAEAARDAVLTQRMFNLMHLESGVKVDLIVRKSSDFRQLLVEPADMDYIHKWAPHLGVVKLLSELMP